MDARAGGVSEADEAGAPTELIRAQTGHTLASTTERYKRGGDIEGSRTVARLRNAHRAAANGHWTDLGTMRTTMGSTGTNRLDP